MLDILRIVLPVFLVIGTGYLAAHFKYIDHNQSSVLTRFATQLAIPCLLFLAVSGLDLSKEFNLSVLLPFYVGALCSFTLVWLGAGLIFNHNPGVRVAIGFAGLFSNLVLIGLAIVELAYGDEALKVAFAIVAIHAPFCYVFGITAMEFSRSDGLGFRATLKEVFRQVFSNALMIGILLGFVVNLAHISTPAPIEAALEFFARSALPVALFGLGAMLVNYRLNAGLGEVGMISLSMLILHPLVAYLLGMYVFHLPIEILRPIVLMAAMPPGMNVYIFANMYDRATGIAASSVLLSTMLSVITISVWLVILG